MEKIDLNKFTSSKPRGRKKGSKNKKEKQEKPIEKVVKERAAAQIIARAQKKADAMDATDAEAIMKQLEYQAKCNIEGKYKLVFTGASYLKIYPDGSKEVEIPQGLRGKLFNKYRGLLLATDIMDDED